MREFLSRFRFGDFAAYFLPGLIMLTAIVWALTLTIFGEGVRVLLREITFVEGLLLACLAYIMGAFLSGSSNRLFPHIYRLSRREPFRNARCLIYPSCLSKAVTSSFKQVFGDEVDGSTWSEDKFYLIRSIVNEKMPHASADAARQNDLMRLRENMVIPLVSLWIVTVAFAFTKGLRDLYVGVTVGAIASVSAYIAAGRLAGRASDNRAREVREVCTAFVVGARLGMFAAPTQQATDQTKLTLVGEQMTVVGDASREVLPIVRPTPGTA